MVYQHNNVMNWSLNQLAMFLFHKDMREARRKFLARGGDKSAHGGDSKFFGWGGTALDGGDYPLKGGVPPIPPLVESPGTQGSRGGV